MSHCTVFVKGRETTMGTWESPKGQTYYGHEGNKAQYKMIESESEN